MQQLLAVYILVVTGALACDSLYLLIVLVALERELTAYRRSSGGAAVRS